MMNFLELLEQFNLKLEDIKGAFVHSSFANLNGLESNERLEFIGDNVLNLCVSLQLFETNANENEGEMSKNRSKLVSTKNLAEIFDLFKLGTFLKIAHKASDKVKANTIEAIIAASFFKFKKNLQKTLKFIEHFVVSNSKNDFFDFKTALQEILQKNHIFEIKYESISLSNKTFSCTVLNNGRVLAKGAGKTKKEAEQNSAKNALKIL